MADTDDIAIDTETGDAVARPLTVTELFSRLGFDDAERASTDGLGGLAGAMRSLGNAAVAPMGIASSPSIAEAFRIAPQRGQFYMQVGAGPMIRPGDLVALDDNGRAVLPEDPRAIPGGPTIGVVESVRIDNAPGGALVASVQVRARTNGDALLDTGRTSYEPERSGAFAGWTTPPSRHHAESGWETWLRGYDAVENYGQLARRVVGSLPGLRLDPAQVGVLAVCAITSARGCASAHRLRDRRNMANETARYYMQMGAISADEAARAFDDCRSARRYRRRDVRRALKVLAPHLRVASDAMLEGRRAAAIAALIEVIPLAVAQNVIDR